MKNQVLSLRKSGKSYLEICEILGISKSTVSYHCNPKVKEGYRDRQTKRRRECKKALVEKHGGGCSLCGYSKSINALQFHHIDPKEKEFGVNSKRWSLWRAAKEAQKCVLLCANCHFELHDKNLACARIELASQG